MTDKNPRNSENTRSIPIIVALIGAAATTLIAAFVGNKGGFSFLPGTPVKVVTMPPRTPEPQVTVTITSGATNQPKGIYHEGPLALSNSNQVDLDAPPNDPQWGVINLTPGDSYSIESAPGEIDVENGAQAVQLKSAGNGTCASATGYSMDRLGVQTPPLKVDQYICVHTAGGRFSLFKIVGLSADGFEFSRALAAVTDSQYYAYKRAIVLLTISGAARRDLSRSSSICLTVQLTTDQTGTSSPRSSVRCVRLGATVIL